MQIKESGLFFFTVLVFLAGSVYVLAWNSANPDLHGHTGDNVFVYVNGNNKGLQTAINDGDFSSSFTGGGSYSSPILFGQPGEEIIVNVGGNAKSFQEAINDGSLCNAAAGTSPSNFGTEIYGNTGNEIKITIGTTDKDLQTAINDGDFSCHRNLALDGIPSGIWINNNGGPITNINDGNNASYIGTYCYSDGCAASLTGYINFTTPVQLENLRFYLNLNWGGTSHRWGGYANISVLSGDAWRELPRTWDTIPGDIRDWGWTPPNDIVLEASGNWSNVTSVKVYLYGAIGGHTSAVWLRLYEVEAFGKES